jgi:hypothetical protein
MTLENIPEGYTPLSNIINNNDIKFSFKDLRMSYNYCGISTYKEGRDVYVLCVKNEYIDKLKNYFAIIGMNDSWANNLAEINTIPDLLQSFKVEYGLHPDNMKADPILAKQIVDSYPSDRIKQMLKNKLFGTPIEGEWETIDFNLPIEPENVIDELPF